MTGPVLAFDPVRRTNARLIVDAHHLGYLDATTTVLDVTYGTGRFWSDWRPPLLVTSDLDPRVEVDVRWDFTRLPPPDRWCDVVVFDPPYKLNGTSGHPSDDGYGVGGPYQSVEAKLRLIEAGVREAARVAGKHVLVKCQDQVVSGRKVWQTDLVSSVMSDAGWRKVDRLEVHGHRPQPPGRRQVHARTTTSTLLVFGGRA